jgi:hypothetical protein
LGLSAQNSGNSLAEHRIERQNEVSAQQKKGRREIMFNLFRTILSPIGFDSNSLAALRTAEGQHE